MHLRAIKRIVAVWVLLVILVAIFGKVSVAATGAGQTSADFLLIGVGANASGMGGAYSAVTTGASSAYWNPAALSGLEYTELTLSHFSWYQDITLEHGAVAFPLNDRLTAAASITFLDYGTIEGYDATGAAIGDISSYDWQGGVSVGYWLNDELSIGATGKFVNQKLANYSASTVAVDLGAKYELPAVTFAAVVANVGGSLKFDQVDEKLPTLGKLAVAFRPFGSSFLTAVELEKKVYGDITFRHGIEFNYGDRYYIRGGYTYYPGDEIRPFGTGLSFGLGLRFSGAGLDYAYTPKDSYTSDDLHRFSLSVGFGK